MSSYIYLDTGCHFPSSKRSIKPPSDTTRAVGHGTTDSFTSPQRSTYTFFLNSHRPGSVLTPWVRVFSSTNRRGLLGSMESTSGCIPMAQSNRCTCKAARSRHCPVSLRGSTVSPAGARALHRVAMEEESPTLVVQEAGKHQFRNIFSTSPRKKVVFSSHFGDHQG